VEHYEQIYCEKTIMIAYHKGINFYKIIDSGMARLDCTPVVRQIGLEQSARVFGFDKTILQIPPAVCIRERNADVCGCILLG